MDADSGLQGGQPLSAGPMAAIQAALSNPELDPDHPLLQRAQKALEKQLLATKYRLESEVREKSVALQVRFPSACMQSLFQSQVRPKPQHSAGDYLAQQHHQQQLACVKLTDPE